MLSNKETVLEAREMDLRELKEIIQSSNINFLIGAGTSSPFLPLLGNIEKAIQEAKGDKSRILKEYRDYFSGVMYPCLSILNQGIDLSDVRPPKAKPEDEEELSDKEKFDLTYKGYEELFASINKILLNRKVTLVNKQVNIFTTNIDIFMEKLLEDMNLEYNDGFSGNIHPTFQTSNFHKSIHKTSTHFSNVSEIPTFNIVKVHGSLSWDINELKDTILFSKLDLLEDIEKSKSDDSAFEKFYEKLQIINPTKNKFEETVMDINHYELLRMYSSELEKENTVLFVVGFSMEDEHIREITKRVADSNPTLKIYIFCYSDGSTKTKCEGWFKNAKYQNIEIMAPPEEKLYDVITINNDFFKDILDYKKPAEEEELDDEKTESKTEVSEN